ncbi:DUF2269 domain-containing protein [Corynebacterium alimapuense]|uniref:DUF2269 domain-containing protein n=1 Tax=Corynebacterium alimapuense TaxID=1576874 RepID=A0A3M8K6D9_9CORY|nr:DUF2269 domain-containing protein [Corynebacterium alimapuense]RNE48429.1 DUF2269 domain-containing protein [Corynebacterium alimapuense]
MITILIVLHVLAAVLFIGPVTVAVSSFQVQATRAHEGDSSAAGAATVLHKITTTYGVLAALVPLFGVAIMFLDGGYWREGRYHAAIALAVIAWVLLLLAIIPRQKKMMGALGLLDAGDFDPEKDAVANWAKTKSQLSMFGGIFSLLWIIMLVLMYL